MRELGFISKNRGNDRSEIFSRRLLMIARSGNVDKLPHRFRIQRIQVSLSVEPDRPAQLPNKRTILRLERISLHYR